MSDNTAIEWADATWNPIRGVGANKWMCAKISAGCDNCYASTFNRRMGGQHYPTQAGVVRGAAQVETRLHEKAFEDMRRWRKPRRVFVCSMTDLFGEWVPDEWLRRIFDAMIRYEGRQHTFLVLTKRPRRMVDWWGRWAVPMGGDWTRHIWLGVTVERDELAWRANECLHALKSLNAPPTTFVSAEPLLGPLPSLDLRSVDWLITGGESGQNYRSLDLGWVRDLRDRCQEGGVAFFHKQHGGLTPKKNGRLLDGREWSEFPEPARALATV